MSSRYSPDAPDYNFSASGAFGAEPEQKKKPSALEDFLNLAGSVAPVWGTVAGGIGGGVLGAATGGPGVIPGAMAGAGIGGAVGQGLGSLAHAGADYVGRDDEDEASARMNREQERQARAMAALNLLG